MAAVARAASNDNSAYDNVRHRAVELRVKGARLFEAASLRTKRIASDRCVQVTVGCAVGGSSVLGAVGAGTGLFVGGTIGAVVGVPLAIVTFGLSIPISAAVGAGCGSVIGGAVGGTAGC